MKKGFTLIELLVVIAIIALLSSVVLASLSSARMKARNAKRQADLKQIHLALEMFQDANGCLPQTDRGGGSLCTGAVGYYDANSGGWDWSSVGGASSSFLGFLGSQYISRVPHDPLDNGFGDVSSFPARASSTAGGYAYGYYCYPGTPGRVDLRAIKEPGTNAVPDTFIIDIRNVNCQ